MSLPREWFIEQAIDAVATRSRKGRKTSVMRLDRATLADAAARSIFGHETDGEIAADIKRELAKRAVSEGALRAWLERVRREYARQNEARTRDWGRFDGLLKRLDGDLNRRNAVLNESLAVRLMELLLDENVLEADPETLRARAYLFSQVTRATWIHNRHQLDTARIAQIESKIREMDADRDGQTTKGEAADMMRTFLEAMRRPDLIDDDMESAA